MCRGEVFSRWFARTLPTLLVVIAFSATPAPAQIVGIGAPHSNSPNAYVLFRDGSLWSGEYDPDRSRVWSPAGSVPLGPGEHAVGLAGESRDPNSLWAMTSGGTLCRIGGGCGPNIFVATGRVQGEVVAFGNDANVHLFAVTADGDVFSIVPTNGPQVSYGGTVPIGSTATAPTSWGVMKIRYQ